MSSKLATALTTVLAERGLAGNLGEAAKKIGVAYPSLKKVLDGVAKPNKATIGKYQAFLGVDDEDFANLLVSPPGKPARRGRRMTVEAEALPSEECVSTAEKDPTRAISPTTESAYAHGGRREAGFDRALAALDGVLQDGLALRVHAAPAGIRALIARILG